MLLKPTSAIILAAGFSTRMGQPKFGLKLPDGKSFLENIVQQYFDFGCDEIIVVINSEGGRYLKENPFKFNKNLNFALNQSPESGRFGSVQCGVNALKTKKPVFIHNVDNPYARAETLKMLSDNLAAFDFVNPVYNGSGGHPILIGEKVTHTIINQTDPSIKLRSFLKQFNQKEVDVEDPSILFNINTIKDYQQLFNI